VTFLNADLPGIARDVVLVNFLAGDPVRLYASYDKNATVVDCGCVVGEGAWVILFID